MGCGIGDAQTQLLSAVDAKREELSQCYATALSRDANAQGTLKGWVHVEDKQGRVDSVEFEQADISDQQFHGCISASLTQIQLTQPPAANLKVEYTFEFHPEG
jgi:hypothetical protein